MNIYSLKPPKDADLKDGKRLRKERKKLVEKMIIDQINHE